MLSHANLLHNVTSCRRILEVVEFDRFVVTVDEGVHFSDQALLAFLKDHLADYKLPRRAILLPALPRNAAGKILKTRLREMLATK